MIRPIVFELALFLTPFAAYALLLWGRKAGVFDPESWPLRTVVGLTAVALGLVVISALVAVQYSGAPPGSVYVPAHMEGGRLVPGTTK